MSVRIAHDRSEFLAMVWMDKLRAHYTGSTGSSLLTERYKFWTSSQVHHESIQEWEVKVRHADSLCGYGDLRPGSNVELYMCRP